MRPLNRPMFRYGGPIKEGIMSGIRENYKRAGLVGDPVYPRTNGREHHSRVSAASKLPIVGGILQKTRGWMPRAWDKIRGWTGSTAQYTPVTKVTKPPVTKWSGGYHGTVPGGTGYQASGAVQKVWTPKGWVARDPLWKIGSKVYEGKGFIGKPIKGLYNLAKTPTGGIGLTYVGYQWLKPDGSKANQAEINEHLSKGGGKSGGVPGGGDPGMKGTGEWFAAQAEKEALAKEQKAWDARIKKYRDIMDIKGMNKEAAYKSLIDASKLIQESQDFKGDIKSGNLINQIIQATSKQFDKPSKTSDAINTLILQNELKKDLNKEANALDKAYKQSAIAINEAKLAENTLAGDIRKYTSTNKTLPAGNTLAGFATGRGYPIKGVEDTTIVKNWMKENNGTEVDYLQSKITDIEVAPGLYVINDKILQIDENKRVTPVSTSSM